VTRTRIVSLLLPAFVCLALATSALATPVRAYLSASPAGFTYAVTAADEFPYEEKAWICKLSGEPGDPELAEGRNPIQVAASSVEDGRFDDRHGSPVVDGEGVDCTDVLDGLLEESDALGSYLAETPPATGSDESSGAGEGPGTETDDEIADGSEVEEAVDESGSEGDGGEAEGDDSGDPDEEAPTGGESEGTGESYDETATDEGADGGDGSGETDLAEQGDDE